MYISQIYIVNYLTHIRGYTNFIFPDGIKKMNNVITLMGTNEEVPY